MHLICVVMRHFCVPQDHQF